MQARRGAVAVATALLLAAGACSSESGAAGGEDFRTASLDRLEPAAQEPPADVARTTSAAATLATFQRPLDACRGPVAIDVGAPGRPLLVSEHDYCGGAAWIPDLGVGDVVALDGPGVDDGRYEVTTVDTHRRRQVFVRDLRPEADVVLQTCVSRTRLVLVALVRVPDARA